MTLVVLLLLGLGAVLMLSAAEGVSFTQTVRDIWNDQVTLDQSGQSQNTGLISTTHGTGPQFQPIVQGAGVQPLIGRSSLGGLGSAAGPAQQDAYRQAVVRAYLQSRR